MAMGAERASVYDGQAAKFVVQFSTSPAQQRWFSPFAGVSPGLQRDSAASARQKSMVSRSASQMGATCAFAGSVLLFIGTYLHPMGADPNQAIAAFAEYAADRLWIASHLTQLAGLTLIVAALLLLAQQLRGGERRGVGRNRGRRSDRQPGGGRGVAGRRRHRSEAHGGRLGGRTCGAKGGNLP